MSLRDPRYIQRAKTRGNLHGMIGSRILVTRAAVNTSHHHPASRRALHEVEEHRTVPRLITHRAKQLSLTTRPGCSDTIAVRYECPSKPPDPKLSQEPSNGTHIEAKHRSQGRVRANSASSKSRASTPAAYHEEASPRAAVVSEGRRLHPEPSWASRAHTDVHAPHGIRHSGNTSKQPRGRAGRWTSGEAK